MVKPRIFRQRFQLAAALLLALLALAALAHGRVQASPPAPIDIVITQPDGSQVTARQWGDEWLNGLETTGGYTLLKDEASGFFVYAERSASGELQPALVNGQMLVAGRDQPAGLPAQARPDAPTAPQRAPSRPLPETLALNPELAAAPPVQASGPRPTLVILAEFTDQKHKVTSTPAYFEQAVFGITGSVKHYYEQASNNLLTLTQAKDNHGNPNGGVTGWVDLGIDHPNPGNMTPGISNLIAERALEAARVTYQINYADFDKDGDGYVTSDELLILIVAAGYEKAFGSTGGLSIWAHEHYLRDPSFLLDGVYVGKYGSQGEWGGYAMVGEIHGNGFNDHPATIGVMAHEMGHLLSLPDLYGVPVPYNPYNSLWEGVGEWSIMGSGNWNKLNQPGDSPALPDAWSRWYLGWITPQPIATDGTITPLAAAGGPPAAGFSALLVGSNPGGVDWRFFRHSGTGQYWLVENRQKAGYDAGLPGCGLLIWHVREEGFADNYANTYPGYPLLALEQADGKRDLEQYPTKPVNRGDSGDPYPGFWGKTVFGPNTNPNSSYSNLYGEQTPSNITLNINSPLCAPTMNVSASVLQPPYHVYLPQATKGPLYATGTLRLNGAALAGQALQIQYSTNDGDSYAAYGSPALTGADGRYALRLPPLYAGGQRYYVLWSNTSESARLGRFECTSRTKDETTHICDFDVAGINLIAPAPNTSVDPPKTFFWTQRAFIDDSYALQLYKTNGSLWWHLGLSNGGYLGYTDRTTVFSAPPDAQLNTDYYWSVRVKTAAGVGFAYERRGFKFSALTSPPLALPSDMQWFIDGP